MAVRLVVRHRNSAGGAAGDLSFEFEQARIVIGRSPGADVRLPDAAVSETHATLERRGSHYALRDERSRNGSAVNGAALVPERWRVLAAGDEITIADFRISFTETAAARVLTSPERTASLARRMLRELLGQEHEASAPPELEVSEGPDRGAKVGLQRARGRLVIGSGAGAGLRLSDRAVASSHLAIESDEDGVIARSASESGGFEVNGKEVRERRLRHGDVLALGQTRITFHDRSEQALRALEREPVRTLSVARATPTPEPTSNASAPNETSDSAAASTASESDGSNEAGAGSSPLDYLVYALASLILAASVTGLVWLLK